MFCFFREKIKRTFVLFFHANQDCFYFIFRTSLDCLELTWNNKMVVMGGIEPPTLAL